MKINRVNSHIISKKITTAEARTSRSRTNSRIVFYLVLCLVIISTITSCSTVQIHDGVKGEPLLVPQIFRFKDGGEAHFYAFDIGRPSPDDPLFFFISGSGCQSVRHRFPGYFSPIQNLINARVLVLQKRNLQENAQGGKCTSAFAHTDYFRQSVADQEEFIHHQLAVQTGKPKAVVVIGASEGAVVAAKAASTEPGISHLALIGSGGETVRKNLQLLSAKKWYFFGLKGKLEAISKNPDSVQRRAWGQTYKYWSSLLDVNIGELLLSLDIPIIIAMGEEDESVPIDTALALKKRFNKEGRDNLTLLVFPHANHRLQDVSHSRHYAKEFLESIVYCLQSTSGLPASLTRCSLPEKMQEWIVN